MKVKVSIGSESVIVPFTPESDFSEIVTKIHRSFEGTIPNISEFSTVRYQGSILLLSSKVCDVLGDQEEIEIKRIPPTVLRRKFELGIEDYLEHKLSIDDTTSVPSFKPRRFQTRVLEKAIRENIIVVAPTGSGKTLISVMLAEMTHAHQPNKVIIFIAPTGPLVAQQARVFDQMLRCKIGKYLGSSGGSEQFVGDLPFKAVMCVTPGLFYNLLKEGKFALDQASLLILDECHHTTKESPYARMMKEYYHPLKASGGDAPKVFGMTASPASKNTLSLTVTELRKLTGLLDARMEVVTEKDIAEEDGMYANPNMRISFVGDVGDEDPLQQRVMACIEQVQSWMRTDIEQSDRPELVEQFALPGCSPDTSDFETWARKCERSQIIRGSCFSFYFVALVSLSKCLQALDEIDSADALEDVRKLQQKLSVAHAELEEEMKGKNKVFASKQLAVVQTIIDIMHESRLWEEEDIKEIEDHPKRNPKFMELKQALAKLKSEPVDSLRVLVFVKRRRSARKMTKVLNADPSLSFMKFRALIGQGTSSSKKREGVDKKTSSDAGMTQADQQKVVLAFRTGEVQCLVCTAIGEEGIDVPTCSLVIRYDEVGRATELIQSRGRARKKDSNYLLILRRASQAEKQYNKSVAQEEHLKRALEWMQANPSDPDLEPLAPPSLPLPKSAALVSSISPKTTVLPTSRLSVASKKTTAPAVGGLGSTSGSGSIITAEAAPYKDKNAISALHEFCQMAGHPNPSFDLIEDCPPNFQYQVVVAGRAVDGPVCRGKQLAKTHAALFACKKLKV